MYKNLNLNKISEKKYEYRQKENFPLMDFIKAKDFILQNVFIKRNFYFWMHVEKQNLYICPDKVQQTVKCIGKEEFSFCLYMHNVCVCVWFLFISVCIKLCAIWATLASRYFLDAIVAFQQDLDVNIQTFLIVITIILHTAIRIDSFLLHSKVCSDIWTPPLCYLYFLPHYGWSILQPSSRVKSVRNEKKTFCQLPMNTKCSTKNFLKQHICACMSAKIAQFHPQVLEYALHVF